MNPWLHPPEMHRLMVWMTYHQDTETYAPLVHKSQGFEKISVILQLD